MSRKTTQRTENKNKTNKKENFIWEVHTNSRNERGKRKKNK